MIHYLSLHLVMYVPNTLLQDYCNGSFESRTLNLICCVCTRARVSWHRPFTPFPIAKQKPRELQWSCIIMLYLTKPYFLASLIADFTLSLVRFHKTPHDFVGEMFPCVREHLLLFSSPTRVYKAT